MKKYRVIGLMSGTSLDGLDIAYCEFIKGRVWKFRIVDAGTIKYTAPWKKRLSSAFRSSPGAIAKTDREFGTFMAQQVLKFIKKKRLTPDLIASHGHTVFHQPEKKYTLQIGSGGVMSSICRLPVICDFRSGDVELGGQGAPLVPMADKLLFSQYDLCLNLGGIANISYDILRGRQAQRIAFDICPVNIVLNALSSRLGKEFDSQGRFAAKGKVNHDLLRQLNRLSFYKVPPPKSLGREWIERRFFPVLDSFKCPVKDKLRTVVEHAAIQIAAVANAAFPGRRASLLITGGGAYNTFLLKRISAHTTCRITVPPDRTVQFKEAMAFAFLGVLKMRGEINILQSVTGATKDSSGGRMYRVD